MILIIEDDPAIVNLLTCQLQYAGFLCDSASDGLEGEKKVKENRYDLVILDLMLPEIDGFTLLEQIKKREIPVIIISALDQVGDRIKGLESGADDYLCKPFESVELVARIKCVLRRWEKIQPVLEIDGFTIHFEQKKVFRGAEEVPLTPKEYDLLECLAENQGIIFSRRRLLDRIWGYNEIVDSRTVDMHITRLRAKLETKTIQTVYKRGYRMEIAP